MHFEEFRVAVEEEVLDDLRRRLRRTRWLDQIPESGWAYGTDTEYLRELCQYWEAEYDWREAERELNRWPQFVTSVGGQRLHFIHARSPHPHARPLLLTHGWPSTVAEFLRVLDPLTDPVRHGGDAADAFHVIAPSIPGYAWSGPTIEQGWSMGRVAAAFVALLDRLGYQRFGLHGGDWGSLISEYIGVPTGVAVFPRELFRATRRIAARHYNIERWVELPRGGHFPAAEQPDLLVGELRAFYRGRK